MFSSGRFLISKNLATLKRFKSGSSTTINVSNYETGFNSKPGKVVKDDESLVEELDLLSLSFEPKESDNSVKTAGSASPRGPDHRRSTTHPNRSILNKYPTGGVAKQRYYNCGQIGHVSFDCQQPQVRKACYTCGNSGHLARDCPQSQRPIICYVCRQPGHLASKCPSGSSSKFRSNNGSGEKGGEN